MITKDLFVRIVMGGKRKKILELWEQMVKDGMVEKMEIKILPNPFQYFISKDNEH